MEAKTGGSRAPPPGLWAAPVAKAASGGGAGTNSASRTGPPVAIKPPRNPRRLTFSIAACTCPVMSRSCSGRLDGGGDALITAAAADVAAHRTVDLVFGRVLVRRDQCGGLHDLARLAIPALRDIQGAPGFLHRMVALRIEPLDRRHRPPGSIVYGGDAGAGRLAVDLNRAGAAQRHAAAVFCAGEPQFVPQIPEQRHRRIAVERLLLAVDAQLDHCVPLRLVPTAGFYPRRSGPGNIVNQPAGLAEGSSKGKAGAGGAGDWGAGAVTARVGGTGGLGDEHRGSRRERAERIKGRVERVLQQAEEVQVGSKPIARVQVQP